MKFLRSDIVDSLTATEGFKIGCTQATLAILNCIPNCIVSLMGWFPVKKDRVMAAKTNGKSGAAWWNKKNLCVLGGTDCIYCDTNSGNIIIQQSNFADSASVLTKFLKSIPHRTKGILKITKNSDMSKNQENIFFFFGVPKILIISRIRPGVQ